MAAIIIVSSFSSSQYSQLGLSGRSPEPFRAYQKTPIPQIVLVGGQNGAWFSKDQSPTLSKVDLTDDEPISIKIPTVSGQGTVWTGGWNGTDWLFTGWGDINGLNPYYDIYNGNATAALSFANYTQAISAEAEWDGGDIFSATWNGTVWLLAGMGSGSLYSGQGITNHYSMAFLTAGGEFIDLSQSIPNNTDGILYASSWNGQEWLVGGGWYGYKTGVLYLVSQNGIIHDITSIISKSVPSFSAVQSLAWNGDVWMIGGVGFLAEYNPTTGQVRDMTGMLDSVLGQDSLDDSKTNSVNSIAWVNDEWIFAGGVTIAYRGQEAQTAWIASMDPISGSFSDLTTSALPASILNNSNMSSIISISCQTGGCMFGGFAGSNPILVWYNGVNSVDFSHGLNMTYIQWVALSQSG